LHEARATLASAGVCWRNSTGVDVERGVRYGLGIGGADLVAIVPVRVVCPCGQTDATIGRFVGVEIKSPSGRLSIEQRLWGDAVMRAHGGYYVVRSGVNAVAVLEHARLP